MKNKNNTIYKIPRFIASEFDNNKRSLMSRFKSIFEDDKKKRGYAIVGIVVIFTILLGSFFVLGDKAVKQVNDSLTIYFRGGIDNIDSSSYVSYSLNDAYDHYSFADSYRVIPATSDYQWLYPDVKVNIVDLSEMSDDAFNDKLTSDLILGKGPDVIVGGEQLMNVHNIDKMMRSGAFAELDDFIKNDPEQTIIMDDYYPAMLKTGFYKGSQYILPIRFDFSLIGGAKSKLDNVGIDSEKCKKDYIGLLTELNNYVAEDGSIPIFPVQNTILSNIYSLGGTPSADNSNLDTDQFREMCELYKSIYQHEQTQPPDVTNNIHYGVCLRESKILLANTPDALIHYNITTAYSASSFDTPVAIPLRKPSGGIDARITAFAAINANSANKQNAYNYIKLIGSQMSEYYFAQQGMSANKEFNMRTVKLGYNHNYAFSEDYYDQFALTDAQKEEVLSFADEVDRAFFISPFYSEVKQILIPYLGGEQTYEECIKQLQDKVEIYATE